MYRRRRRREREIAFSLDSFLDVITNIIGIIIRMILVVWVGARSYHEIQSRLQLAALNPAAAEQKTGVEKTDGKPTIADPLEEEIARHRAALQAAQESLLEHLRQLPPLSDKQQEIRQQLAVLASQLQGLEQNHEQAKLAIGQQEQVAHNSQLSLAELNQRGEKLKKDIAQLSQLPAPRKTIQYRTPVSRLVEQEELFFECQNGRVTFLDMAALRGDMVEEAHAQMKELTRAGSLEGVTRQVGAFRLRYTLKVNQAVGLKEGTISAAAAAEPVAALRGETLEQASQPSSDFRQIVDFADAKQTVVTFWVYPDSFPLFRQLRDYLYQRDLEVAGRPIPAGHFIGFSPNGTASRSQ